MLSPWIQAAIAASFLVVAALALGFARRQNLNPKLGGAISRPKQLWLGYAIFVWFFLTPLIALEPRLDGTLRTILAVFAALMWIRGVAEMVMMYVTKSWKPPYGITHDLICIAVILGLSLVNARELASLGAPLDRWTSAYVAALVVSLCFETYYAFAFFGAVEGRTTGEDGVWFASEDDPRFIRINRVTRIGNTLLCSFQAAYALAVFG